MEPKSLRRAFALSTAFLCLGGASAFTGEAKAQLTLRRSMVVEGASAVTGNGLYDCPTSSSCANNNAILTPVDVDDLALGDRDGDGEDDTEMSSSATLTLPTGATVRAAYLYVSVFASSISGATSLGGPIWVTSTTPFDYPALFAAPGGEYVSLVPEAVSDDVAGTGETEGLVYEARYDVSSLVHTGGVYTVADPLLAPSTHGYQRNGLWALVVFYDDGGPKKLVNLYDGIVHCGLSSTTEVEVAGFRTPAAGPIGARLTAWGDDGARSAPGESIRIGSTALSNSENPSNNVGNGTVSDIGGPIVRAPMTFRVTEPVDIDTFDASAAFTNGQEEATITFACSAMDGLLWYGTVLSFDVIAPDLRLVKSVTDVNGGVVLPGDELVYTLTLTGVGGDDSISVLVRDVLPANTTYIPGSIEYLDGASIGARTDLAGDDPAEISGTTLTLRMGTGANATTGGALAIGETTRATFRVRVGTLTAPTVISNTAVVSYRGAGGGTGTTDIEAESERPEGPGPTVIDALPCADFDADAGMCPAGDAGVDAGGITDAGPPTSDGSVVSDAGGPMTAVDDGGCGCAVPGARGSMPHAALSLRALAILWLARKRRPR